LFLKRAGLINVFPNLGRKVIKSATKKEIQANQEKERGDNKETKSYQIFLVYKGLMVGGN
jgi:hypothetical protein